MQMRRFSAKDVPEALRKVKAELGDDAIILSTRNRCVQDGATGRKISFVEVVAAVDRQDEDVTRPTGVQRGRQEDEGPAPPRFKDHSLLNEIDQLKAEIRRLSGFVQALSEERGIGDAGRAVSKRDMRTVPERGRLVQAIASCLCLDRRSEDTLARILGQNDRDETPFVWKESLSRLSKFFTAGIRKGPAAEDAEGRCWWAFVGPTGVGKTTTLAKIAARLKFLCKKDGVLICTDGYRLGAKEQLGRYASLMDIPMESARTNKDLLRLFSKYREKDFIFVDTTGRNPFSSTHKKELLRLFDSIPGLMAQVMLSATVKREDLMGAISFYRQFPLAGWTLTKIDETRTLASSLFPVIESELPVCYVTNGQRVPEDIAHARPAELARKALEPLRGLDGLMGVSKRINTDNIEVVPETI